MRPFLLSFSTNGLMLWKTSFDHNKIYFSEVRGSHFSIFPDQITFSGMQLLPDWLMNGSLFAAHVRFKTDLFGPRRAPKDTRKRAQTTTQWGENYYDASQKFENYPNQRSGGESRGSFREIGRVGHFKKCDDNQFPGRENHLLRDRGSTLKSLSAPKKIWSLYWFWLFFSFNALLGQSFETVPPLLFHYCHFDIFDFLMPLLLPPFQKYHCNYTYTESEF